MPIAEPIAATRSASATTQEGGLSALAIGSYEQKEPFRQVARANADARESGPAFAFARSERELWVGSGRSSRYELDIEAGMLKAGWSLAE